MTQRGWAGNEEARKAVVDGLCAPAMAVLQEARANEAQWRGDVGLAEILVRGDRDRAKVLDTMAAVLGMEQWLADLRASLRD